MQPLVLVLVLLPVLLPVLAAAKEGRARIDTPPPPLQEAAKPSSYEQLLRRLQTFFTNPKGSSTATTPTMTTSFTPGTTKPSLAQPFPVLGGRKETWAEQPDLQIISRLLDGDHHNLLAELIQVCGLSYKSIIDSFYACA